MDCRLDATSIIWVAYVDLIFFDLGYFIENSIDLKYLQFMAVVSTS